jgi:hypothetical protein
VTKNRQSRAQRKNLAKPGNSISKVKNPVLYIAMKEISTGIINTTNIESKFLFSKKLENISMITDDQGQKLGFHRTDSGSQVIFTKDSEGVDVAVEHCIDGTKVFHLSQDSKGLPAMHEFKADGTEIMYLLNSSTKLEKTIENKSNGDKISTWYNADEIVSQEQRQNGGIIFKLAAFYGEALVWLHTDGSVEASGDESAIAQIQELFARHLDGALLV